MKTAKISLAVVLFLCLFPLPYGVYMLVRFCAMIGFAIFAYCDFLQNKQGWACTFGVLALLFQPFLKVALGRGMWCVADVVAAALLLYTLVDRRG